MTYTLRVNGKTLNTINEKTLRNLIYKGITYEIGSAEPTIKTLQTPMIYLVSETPEISTTAILGQAILGYAILGEDKGKPKLNTPIISLVNGNLETLSTPSIYLVSDEILETLDTPIIYLTSEEEIKTLDTPTIHLESDEPDEPIIIQLDTPSIYLESDTPEEPDIPDDPIITQLATPEIYLESVKPEEPEEPEEPDVPEDPWVVTHVFTVIPSPSDAKVTFIYKGETYVQNSIIVNSGDLITWKVSAEGYLSQGGTEVVISEIQRHIVLRSRSKLNTPEIYLKSDAPVIAQLLKPTIYLETI